MTKIDPSLYLNSQTRGSTSSNLGKDEFLKILMAQLKNQDPLNPMEDKEFISQMTSFSSLEQMMNMSKSMDNLVGNLSVTPVLKYSHLINKEVTYHQYDDKTGEIKNTLTGTVKAVSQSNGQAYLELGNGEKIYANEVVKVSEPQAE